MNTLSYNSFPHDGHIFYYAYSNKGIAFVGSPDKPLSEIYNFINVDYLIQKPSIKYETTLINLLSGKNENLSLNLDLTWSTDFQKSVYNSLSNIPFGTTMSYSEIASFMNMKKSTRAIASAIAKNPLLLVIPCHRVIHKDGTLGGYRGGSILKKKLLALENKKYDINHLN